MSGVTLGGTAPPTVDRPAAPAPESAPVRGRIDIDPEVVAKIAGQVAAEVPDAGSAASRVLGVALPGSGLLGTRSVDLAGRPKVSARVDGRTAVLDVTVSVRWPASIRTVTSQIRARIRDRVEDLTGLQVAEVHIVVADLAADLPTPPRVR